MNIVITGFMASGKTEISRAVAKCSHYRFLDTDDMIVELAKKSINSIFKEHGEVGFRRMEREIIKKAAALDSCVIATGGGVPLDESNMNELRKNGVIVNLSPKFEVIESRLNKAIKTRPLLRGQSILQIRKRFDERKPFYDNCDIQIEITEGKTAEECASEILEKCGKETV